MITKTTKKQWLQIIIKTNKLQSYIDEKDLTEQELKEAVVSLKPNKSPGCDSIHINVIKAIYEELKRPLFYIFYQSLKSGIFPDKLKIAKVFPIYKSGKKYVLSNYRPISVLPCFSKILEILKILKRLEWKWDIEWQAIWVSSCTFNRTCHTRAHWSSQ